MPELQLCRRCLHVKTEPAGSAHILGARSCVVLFCVFGLWEESWYQRIYDRRIEEHEQCTCHRRFVLKKLKDRSQKKLVLKCLLIENKWEKDGRYWSVLWMWGKSLGRGLSERHMENEAVYKLDDNAINHGTFWKSSGSYTSPVKVEGLLSPYSPKQQWTQW